VDATIDQGGGDGCAPLETITEPELVEQRDRVAVGAEEVVVELLEPQTGRELEPSGKATRKRLPFEDGDPVSAA
jgi:hypothetical protein